jgi:hypothetical protein
MVLGGLLLALEVLLGQDPGVCLVEELREVKEIVRAVAVAILPLVADFVAAAMRNTVPGTLFAFVAPYGNPDSAVAELVSGPLYDSQQR